MPTSAEWVQLSEHGSSGEAFYIQPEQHFCLHSFQPLLNSPLSTYKPQCNDVFLPGRNAWKPPGQRVSHRSLGEPPSVYNTYIYYLLTLCMKAISENKRLPEDVPALQRGHQHSPVAALLCEQEFSKDKSGIINSFHFEIAFKLYTRVIDDTKR